jgi:putative peptide zinc metalloprotease protein
MTQAPSPQLAHGIELIGEFEGSGFKVTPHLARRADGQVVQLTQLLYLVAEVCDGRRDVEAIADVVTEQYGRRVTGDNVQFLVDEKLRPLGLLARPDGSSPELT